MVEKNHKRTVVMKFMQPYSEQTYALMRIVSGFLFLWHGT